MEWLQNISYIDDISPTCDGCRYVTDPCNTRTCGFQVCTTLDCSLLSCFIFIG